MSYRKKRYIVYLCITLFVISLPFIKINNNQIFLLSFIKKELHLFGSVFNIQEFYVMPFLLILLFVGIFFITTLLGRFWCGWSCPQTIFRVIYRDLIEAKIFGLNKISNKQTPQDLSTLNAKLKKLLSLFFIGILCFSASAVFLFYFVPPSDFFAYLSQPSQHLVLFGFWVVVGAFFTLDIAIFKENFCIYVCPYCRVQSVLYDDDTQTVIYDEKRGGEIYNSQGEKISTPLKERLASTECIECQKCVKVCPTHIDIRAGMQLECINCLECVDACTSVMQKLNRPTLVSWTSSNAISKHQKVHYWRGKTIGYVCVLLLCVVLAIFMGTRKDELLLNITRPTTLYSIQDSSITNDYILLLENSDSKSQHFKISVQHPNIDIVSPTDEIYLRKGRKKRVILVLKYKGEKQKPSADLSIPIAIKLTSIENPLVFIQKESVFIYPKEER